MKHTEEVVASSVIESFKDECQPDTGSPEEDIEKKSISVLENYPSTVSADENQATDPNIVDWDGPNDPENPLNWTTTRKVAAIATVSLITFLSYVFLSDLNRAQLTTNQPARIDHHIVVNIGRAHHLPLDQRHARRPRHDRVSDRVRVRAAGDRAAVGAVRPPSQLQRVQLHLPGLQRRLCPRRQLERADRLPLFGRPRRQLPRYAGRWHHRRSRAC